MYTYHPMKFPLSTLKAIGADPDPGGTVEKLLREWKDLPLEQQYQRHFFNMEKLALTPYNVRFDPEDEDTFAILKELMEVGKKFDVKMAKILRFLIVRHYTPELLILVDESPEQKAVAMVNDAPNQQ